MWRGRHVPQTPVVSVCIPVVSDHGLIHDCLDALVRSRPAAETEVVVVANGLSGDGISSLRNREDIVLVRSDVNTGFSGGNNLAARFARGRYLLLLNDDSIIEAGFVDRLLGAFERDPSVAAVGGRILSADGTLQEAGSVLWRDGWVAHVGLGLPADSTAYSYVRYADYVSANGLLVDRGAWDLVGGLDERYFPAYYEDVDLCLAIREHGYRVAYEPRARLRHLESQSTATGFRNFLLIRNRAQLITKWSARLDDFGDPPDPIDEAAIDAAVLRAEGRMGRVLVVEASADAATWRAPLTIEALAIAGWSVMVSAPPAKGQADGRTDRIIRDRMSDLGVDVRVERPEDLVLRYGSDLGAVVTTGEGTDIGPTPQRPGGASIPQVPVGTDPDESVVARMPDLARRGPDSPPQLDAFGPNEEVAAHGPSDEVTAAHAGIRLAPMTDDVTLRDVAFVQADAAVRREYTEFLEHERAILRAALDKTQLALENTQLALDKTRLALEKTDADFRRVMDALQERDRYIDALPSVRVKKWVVGRLPKHESRP